MKDDLAGAVRSDDGRPDDTAATIDPDAWLHMGDTPGPDRGRAHRPRPLPPRAAQGPVFWAFRDELPMTPSGKIQKFVLREDVVKGLLVFDEVHPTGDAAERSSIPPRTAAPGTVDATVTA